MNRPQKVFAHFCIALHVLVLPGRSQGAGGSVVPPAVEARPGGISAPDWAGITAAHDKALRHLEPQSDGSYVGRNASQQMRVRFDGRGFVARPDSADWQWGLELRRYGRGAKGNLLSARATKTSAKEDRLVYRRDEILSEWYVNSASGLLHGWTLDQRPAGDGDSLDLVLAVRGGLHPRLVGTDAVAFTDSEGTAVLNYGGLKAWDADGRPLAANFAISGRDFVVRVDDRTARYPVTIDPLVKQALLKASNADAGDNFGCSVAASGDTVVIGAYGERSSAVGIDGSQLDNRVVGAGAAYVFVRGAVGWTQQAYLKASNTDTNDYFGYSVAVSGDTIVVGACGESSGATGVNGNQNSNAAKCAGAAYVFVRRAGAWTQQAYLKTSDTAASDSFGWAVAISGDTAVIGASGVAIALGNTLLDSSKDHAGAAYVFARSGGTWIQQANLKASNAGENDRFGCSVAISKDTVVVGAFRESSSAMGVNANQYDNSASESGAAYVFGRNDTGVWTQQAYLKASNTNVGDYFGYSVAISGNTAVVGAPFEDSAAVGINGDESDNTSGNSGAAYVFVRDSKGAWDQQAYLKASNPSVVAEFGLSVAVSGDIAIVGASGEANANYPLYGGNETDYTGVAYAFARSGAGSNVRWLERTRLKASNPGFGDAFGASVAISGDTVIIGAFGEASDPAGANGNNTLSSSGAAYVSQLPPPKSSGETPLAPPIFTAPIYRIKVGDIELSPWSHISTGKGGPLARIKLSVNTEAHIRIRSDARLVSKLTRSPKNGIVRRISNRRFDYVPRDGFVGTDTFRLRVTDTSRVSRDVIVRLSVGAARNSGGVR